MVAAAIAEKSPKRTPVSKFVIKDSPCFIGLNKDEPALLAKINEIIDKAKAAGELGKISEKWLKAPLPAEHLSASHELRNAPAPAWPA